jgi:site-specific DNA-methyltransferase (adenine-specific)
VVLDPFMGSGTTLKAARAEGHRSIGIDLDDTPCQIAWGRLSQGVLL